MDVIVVGAGVVGLSSAYYLRKAGFAVTVLDDAETAGQGCSFGNAGMIVPSHFVPLAAPGMVSMGIRMLSNPKSPFWIRPRLDADLSRWMALFMKSATAAHVQRCAPILRDLNVGSLVCFEQMDKEFGPFGLESRGLLMLCKSQQTLDHEAGIAKTGKALGLRAEVLSLDSLKERDPNIDMDVAGGVHFLDDRHLDPGQFMSQLRCAIEHAGVTIEQGVKVTSVAIKRGGQVEGLETSMGRKTAAEYVIAAGSWSSELSRSAGLRMPMQAGKGYSFDVPSPVQTPTIPSILVEGRVAVSPMPGRLRFSGTMEITGNDLSINRKRIQGICEAVANYYPRFSPKELESLPAWAGLRPCSPDGMPYIGRPKRMENLCFATGHSMMGLSMGPITGKLVSEIVTGAPPSVDLVLLRPDRFA